VRDRRRHVRDTGEPSARAHRPVQVSTSMQHVQSRLHVV
jgi:hypothetical protein